MNRGVRPSLAPLFADPPLPIVLGTFERHLLEMLDRLCPDGGDLALGLAALTSAARASGHACLRLRGPAATALAERLGSTTHAALAELRSARFVRDGDAPAVGPGGETTPFVLDHGALYLDALHLAELAVHARIAAGLATRTPQAPAALVDLDGRLRRLFDVPKGPYTDQMRAALVARTSPVTVITGGPGTGKTTTVVRILAALLEERPDARIVLTAPTGKAAARLAESVREQLKKLDSTCRDAIPTVASTLHRALRMGYERSRTGDGRSELPADLVVVDEASMVDLELMARLVNSLEPEAHLILLGDRDQLASVDAGSVLADLCGPAESIGLLGEDVAKQLAPACPWPPELVARGTRPPLANAVVRLDTSHRFDPDKGIGKLARAVRDGNAADLSAAFDSQEASRFEPGSPEFAKLEARVIEHYAALAAHTDPSLALEHLERLRVLAAVREGDDGVAGWNARIVQALAARGAIDARRAHHHGRPVLVTSNDYEVELWNGDVGVEVETSEGLRVAFPDARAANGYRLVSPVRLPEHETVYAMTIHKSQGTEVHHVVMVLPRGASRVVGRELVYTGITRARREVSVVATEEALVAALNRPVERASGLSERFHGPSTSSHAGAR